MAEAKKIIRGSDFLALISELDDFSWCKDLICEAYKDGQLYGVVDPRAPRELHCSGAFRTKGLLPCLCVRTGPVADIIWTHPRARRRGFARALVQQLGITTAHCPMPGSEGFWEACGIRWAQ